MNRKKKLVIVSTVPMMIFFFLRNHITYLIKDYQVIVLTNKKTLSQFDNFLPEEVIIKNIPFKRKISFFSDIISFLLLFNFLQKNKADIIYSISPKAGLLSMLSGKILSIPIRINNFTGQQWVINKGIKKMLIRKIDRMTASFATLNIVDGKSQQEFLIKNKIINKVNSKVIFDGSISGVDLNRFQANEEYRNLIRKQLKIPMNDIVFIYLGRVNKNKGIEKISRSLIRLIESKNNITFLVVGPEEDKILMDVKDIFHKYPKKLRIVKFTKSPEYYFQASDIFITLSNKEGFGNSVIEAGACGLPAIGSDIYGLRDSIIHNQTGFLVNRDNKNEIDYYLHKFIKNKKIIEKMGNNAKSRVKKLFDQEIITRELIKVLEYLQNKNSK